MKAWSHGMTPPSWKAAWGCSHHARRRRRHDLDFGDRDPVIRAGARKGHASSIDRDRGGFDVGGPLIVDDVVMEDPRVGDLADPTGELTHEFLADEHVVQ